MARAACVLALLAVGVGAAVAPAAALASRPQAAARAAASAPAVRAPAVRAPAAGAPAARVRLYLADVFSVGRHPVPVPHRPFHLLGVLTRYAPGETVALRVTLDGRPLRAERLRPTPIRGSTWGEFRVALSSPGPGQLAVWVSHAADGQLGPFASVRRLSVLSPWVRFGARGPLVSLIQQRLAALHLYVPQTGVYDQGTGWALDAYHRLLGWGTSQTLDGRTLRALLDGLGAFRVRFADHGRHAEGDLGRQLLALVNGSRVIAIYPISSGKPSTPTVLGDFRVYLKVPGYLPDGMYYSNFFYGNYAIHGYDPAPDFPASHGCMRLPIPDAISVYDWLGIGDWVDVYR